MGMITVEVVACSPDDCRAIERAGAHRIELCTGIVAGGVTPSLGLYKACRAATSLPIMAMIRPREGGFCYSAREFEAMRRDVDAFGEAGADGVVFGVLLADGSIDANRMAELKDRAGPMKTMCHRAFDLTPDPLRAIDELVAIGIDRVLSSGQATAILDGLEALAGIMAHAAGRIQVQPCEGIRPENVTQVIERLRPTSIHFGPFIEALDPTSRLQKPVNYGHHFEVDEECVRGVVRLL